MIVTFFALLAATAPAPAQAVSEPTATSMRIPFPERRKQEMAAYSKRHNGDRTYRLTSPKVIVEHIAVASSARAVYNTFAPDHEDPELHELPNVCSHYVVDGAGTAFSLVPTTIRCRHTVGLNHTAIGIEHVGSTDGDLLGNAKELRGSLKLTNQLRCRYGIELKNVIGHNESLSSPFHHELVSRLKTQTHGDMKHASMVEYRRRLAKLSC